MLLQGVVNSPNNCGLLIIFSSVYGSFFTVPVTRETTAKCLGGKEFYEKNKDRTDWEGMAKTGHGRSYVSANAYNKNKFSFSLV